MVTELSQQMPKNCETVFLYQFFSCHSTDDFSLKHKFTHKLLTVSDFPYVPIQPNTNLFIKDIPIPVKLA